MSNKQIQAIRLLQDFIKENNFKSLNIHSNGIGIVANDTEEIYAFPPKFKIKDNE